MKKFELSIFATPSESQAKIEKWYEKFYNYHPTRKREFLDFLFELLREPLYYDWNVYRTAVFAFQHIVDDLTRTEKRNVFKLLYSLTTSEICRKKLAFSNAISITMRSYYGDPAISANDAKNAYDFIINNMPPIPKMFGANRCQLCWNKTLKELVLKQGIEIEKKHQIEIYGITNLNIFQNQLSDSYNEEMNQKLNAFYKSFFGNIKEIKVHDISSKDKNDKKKDKTMQQQGIDKTLVTNDGKQIFIEEKSREPKFWDNRLTDILLEYISIDNRDIPGWVYTSRSEYIVILFKNIDIDKSQLYVFPFKPIREWVRKNDARFKSFSDIIAHNVAWNTISKAVPLDVVLNEILKNEDKKFRKLHNLV